ncbi:hypothetical protein [Flavobacterium aciduliphilum]|uniref:Uncharacterized protein n=1 Tax=Flavobacterium aciduliphilum TaxID=1101402 RepID=A0A328YL24_9FLAO|nr:hypothetical protein [Flavobacterium aciduliphilum]RAR74240.1 hypothetical protein CLV55_102173 [Flavobacterium aciduliphilum]
MEDIILNQFCIGEEFALHEFELEYLKTKTDKNGIDYDYFKFTGKLTNEEVKEILLAYNCDILRGVFVVLKS